MKRATILFTALWLTLGAAAAGNPKADPRAVVEAGNARFTVLTPQLIRVERGRPFRGPRHADLRQP